jgi:hypothetical protein
MDMYRAEMGGLLAGKTERERERAAGCRGAESREQSMKKR